MSRETFHASLSAKGKEFWKAMAGKFGPLKYEGEQAPKGVIIKDYQPHRGTK